MQRFGTVAVTTIALHAFLSLALTGNEPPDARGHHLPDLPSLDVIITRCDREQGTGSARELRKAHISGGALICGRRVFDLSGGWGGNHPAGVPVFVVTHSVPGDWAHKGVGLAEQIPWWTARSPPALQCFPPQPFVP